MEERVNVSLLIGIVSSGFSSVATSAAIRGLHDIEGTMESAILSKFRSGPVNVLPAGKSMERAGCLRHYNLSVPDDSIIVFRRTRTVNGIAGTCASAILCTTRGGNIVLQCENLKSPDILLPEAVPAVQTTGLRINAEVAARLGFSKETCKQLRKAEELSNSPLYFRDDFQDYQVTVDRIQGADGENVPIVSERRARNIRVRRD